MRQVIDLARAKPGVLRARDMVGLIQSSMVMPKEEHNKLLEGLIPQLKKKRASSRHGVKLYLSGHLCMAVKVEILDLIEELGGQVVWDDLYTGSRYVASDASETLPPMEALVQRYFNLGIPCPSRMEPKYGWSDYVLDKVKQAGVQGVIVLMVKQCGPMLLYYPYLKEVFEKESVPYTVIVTEHEVISFEQTKTRIQAFLEMIQRGR
jgi:benzoyl-CoA reductase subunit C